MEKKPGKANPSSPDDKKTGSRSIRFSVTNGVLFAAAALMVVYLLYATSVTMKQYGQVQANMERCMNFLVDADAMMDASDYLTEQVRVFAVTGDPAAAWNYYAEITQTQSRERVLEHLGEGLSDTTAYQRLEAALEQSNLLTQTEYYAMRLAGEARGMIMSELPPPVRLVQLSRKERELPETEKINLAVSKLFDENYHLQKQTIRFNVDECLGELRQQINRQLTDSENELQKLMLRERIMTGVMLLLIVLIGMANYMLITRPLKRIVEQIYHHQRVPMSGSYELQVMEQAYNEALLHNQENQTQLAYQAAHDALTGLYNRSVFESLRKERREQDIAMLLVDVDNFKNVNDTYGHNIGDEVLKKVARNLAVCFRSGDLVCRLGGDEFAAILMHARRLKPDTLLNKLSRVTESLRAGEDGLPPVTLSIGVAFNNEDDPEQDLYREADVALYQVKKRKGKDGIAFYHPEDSDEEEQPEGTVPEQR